MSIANAFPSSPSQHHPNIGGVGRPIPLGGNTHTSGASTAHMSPGARTLHTHAPGQSLPQGLAADYSRIHLRPATESPGSSIALSPGAIQQQQQQHHHHQQQGLSSFDHQTSLSMEMSFGSPPGLTFKLGEHGVPPQAMHANGIGTPGQAPVQTQTQSQAQAHAHAQTKIQTQPSTTQGQSDAGVSGLTAMFSHLSYSSVARGADTLVVSVMLAGLTSELNHRGCSSPTEHVSPPPSSLSARHDQLQTEDQNYQGCAHSPMAPVLVDDSIAGHQASSLSSSLRPAYPVNTTHLISLHNSSFYVINIINIIKLFFSLNKLIILNKLCALPH